MTRAVGRMIMRSLGLVAVGVALFAVTGCTSAVSTPSPSSSSPAPVATSADAALTRVFDWVVYPGGFRLRAAACVPLTIETDAGTGSIQVPIGKRCP